MWTASYRRPVRFGPGPCSSEHRGKRPPRQEAALRSTACKDPRLDPKRPLPPWEPCRGFQRSWRREERVLARPLPPMLPADATMDDGIRGNTLIDGLLVVCAAGIRRPPPAPGSSAPMVEELHGRRYGGAPRHRVLGSAMFCSDLATSCGGREL